ncbi:MAG: transporter substrate-binding domain-containing protein [Magnetococcales bacterium]|nr:transporter substrate-binding domain-containing protein [Magnetococcales bacterium]
MFRNCMRSGFLFLWLMLTAHSAEAKELKVLFSAYTPPYVLVGSEQEQGGDSSGIVVDIVREALEGQGYVINPVFLPIGRGFKMFADGELDATTIIKKNSGLKAYYSDVFMQYHNKAITRSNAPFTLSKIEDLKNRSIIGFQLAARYLGPEFESVVAGNPAYLEIANQERQAHMLLAGRTDVAVMDESIFRFFQNKLISEGKVNAEQAVRYNDLFPPSQYRTAFVEQEVRDHFNQGLARLKNNGRYDAIYQKYTQDYFKIRP